METTRAKIERRMKQAKAEGISLASLEAVGNLLVACTEAVQEGSPDPRAALISGMSVGVAVALANPDAGQEILKVMGVMFGESRAMDHLTLETVPLYLRKRAEAMERDDE